MKKAIKYLIYLSSFMVSASYAADMSCTDLLSERAMIDTNVTVEESYKARSFGELASIDDMMTHLKRLTGALNLDCEGCIEGRYTEEQKKRTRDYIVGYLKSLGLKPKVQKIQYGKVVHKRPGIYAEDLTEEQAEEILTDPKFDTIPEFIEKIEMDLFKDGYKAFLVEFFDKKHGSAIIKKKEEALKKFRAKLRPLKRKENRLRYDLKKSLSKSEEDSMEQLEGAIGFLETLGKELKTLKKELTKGNQPWEEKPPTLLYLHNVIVEIEGTEDKNSFLEVTAHYDTTSEAKPGADDNGSGLITVMELAKLASIHKPKKTLRLSFLDLEEEGFHGSRINVARIKKDKRRFLGSLVVDTIGFAPLRDVEEDYLSQFVVELGQPDMYKDEEGYVQSKALSELFAKQFLSFGNKSAEVNVMKDGVYENTADNSSYWAAGIPAILIAAPYEKGYVNPNYHTKTDTFHYYNVGYFQTIVRAIFEAVSIITGIEVEVSEVQAGLYDEEYNDEVDPFSVFEKEKKKSKSKGPRVVYIEDDVDDYIDLGGYVGSSSDDDGDAEFGFSRDSVGDGGWQDM